jgi:hypothetical protein
MKKTIFLISAFLVSIFLSISVSTATPYFFDIIPKNNSFTFGRDVDVFSVNISESNLNTSSVRLHIRVYESGSTLFNISLSCMNYTSSEWFCNSTVPGFGSLASDGKIFIYYFDASDLSSNYNSSENYFVTIDRSPPVILPSNFQNTSYISKNFKLIYSITDLYSGVNQSSIFSIVEYLYGNTTWNSSWFKMPQEDSYYVISIDTSNFTNNGTIYVYTNASDILGNSNSTRYVLLVDDELPQITIDSPHFNQTLTETFNVNISLTDNYSGLDNSSIKLGENPVDISNCVGSLKSLSCSYDPNSRIFSDGFLNLTFSVKDLANNTGQNSTLVLVDNNPPAITFVSPQAGSQVWGTTFVNASVVDAGVGVDSVNFWWQSVSNLNKRGNTTPMAFQNGVYSVSWNTGEVEDGNYILNVESVDKLNHSSNGSVRVVVDNFDHPVTTTTTNAGSSSGSSSQTTTTTSGTIKSTTTTTSASALRNAANIVTRIVKEIAYLIENPLYKTGLILALICIPLVVFATLRYTKRKKSTLPPVADSLQLDVTSLIENYKNSFDHIYDLILDCLRIEKLDELKDRVRVILVYMDHLEKNLLIKEVINTAARSIENKNVVLEFRRYIEGQLEEIKNIERLKKNYIDRISLLLNNIIETFNIDDAYTSLNEAKNVSEQLKTLLNEEINLLIKYLNRLDFLVKKG